MDTLFKLYQHKDFPALGKMLESTHSDNITHKMFEAARLSAFGSLDASDKIMTSLREDMLSTTNDTLLFVATSTLQNNAVLQSDYYSAALAAQKRISTFRQWIPEEDLEAECEAAKIYSLLRDVSRQQIIKKADTYLSLKKDMAGLLNVPVTVRDSTYAFVFDSGAGMSVVSQSYAEKLGFHILGDSTVNIASGSTGVTTTAQLAVADKIVMGNIEIKKAVFLVFPDSALSFADNKYIIRGIIGFPIFFGLGELAFIEQTTLFIPKHPSKAVHLPNMILDDAMPVIYLKFEGLPLAFTFDTGASSTTLSNNFYERFKPILDKIGIEKSEELHGVGGGSKTFSGLEINQVVLKSDETEILLNNVFVKKDYFPANGKVFYGNIGQDVIRSFKTITFNFNQGYISLRQD